RRGCGSATIDTGHQLCRAELERTRAAMDDSKRITIACTQEAPLFSEIAEEFPGHTVDFVNIRETAGWSNEGGKAGPKMAALLAAAAEPLPETALVSLTSEGGILIYGGNEQAIEA